MSREGGAQVLRRATVKGHDPTGRRGNWALHITPMPLYECTVHAGMLMWRPQESYLLPWIEQAIEA